MMLDDELIYSKTAKGVAEVNARSGAVPLTARRVLIMIDGRRTIAELAPIVHSGEISAIVQQLEAQGLVRPASPATLGATAPAQDDLGEDRLISGFEMIKRRALHDLAERLGPDAEVMAARIDHARSTEELRQRLHEAERLVAGILGDAQAQDFLRSLRRR